MSEVVRLTLVSHAMTDAMAAGRFPADEPLNGVGRRQVAALVDSGAAEREPADRVYCGPEKRTRQTAELLGLAGAVDPRLADLDCGRWRGALLENLPSDRLAVWLSDPDDAPHGGEAIADLVARVRGWLDSLAGRPGRIVAVTHPAVIRAAVLVALDAPPASFWRVDVAPVSRTTMHYRGQAWTLRLNR